ncbi:MAG: hypothetical protein WED34_21550 [Planctomycetales bacterium]
MTFTSTGSISVVTADGNRLRLSNPTSCGRDGLHVWLKAALRQWEELPEEGRRPGAIEVGELENPDPRFDAFRPPSGALIVRVANRRLAREADGSLRYLRADDLDAGQLRHLDRVREPANDFMWVPQEEWRAMVPRDPRAGDTVAVPDAFVLRLLDHHVNPHLGLMGAGAFGRQSLDAARLTLTVEESSSKTVRLKLAGDLALEQDHRDGTTLSYRPAVLGYITYDVPKEAVTRFDMLVLGEEQGRLGGPEYVSGLFSQPRLLGIAFELVSDPSPAEKIRPHAAKKLEGGPQRYLAPLSLRGQ